MAEWEFAVPFIGVLVLYFFLANFVVIFIWLVVWTVVKYWFIRHKTSESTSSQNQ